MRELSLEVHELSPAERYAIFAGTIKGKNQLYRAYDAGKNDPAWFALWQDIDTSLATEDDAATLMLRQAMEDDKDLIAIGLMTQAEFDQEWYLSTAAAIKGAFYTAEPTTHRQLKVYLEDTRANDADRRQDGRRWDGNTYRRTVRTKGESRPAGAVRRNHTCPPSVARFSERRE